MTDPVSIKLIPGPGRGLRILEWGLLTLGLLAPLFLNSDWTWKATLWGLVLMVLVGEIIWAGKRPAISRFIAEKDSTFWFAGSFWKQKGISPERPRPMPRLGKRTRGKGEAGEDLPIRS